jgi:hypothetical protein
MDRAQLVFLAMPLPNSIWLKFTAVVQNAAPGRAPRSVARHGTWRHGMARHGMAASAPPPLYLLAGVTHGAYFYGLYHFAFLECALPGVNQRPQFGQCTSSASLRTLKIMPRNSKKLYAREFGFCMRSRVGTHRPGTHRPRDASS